MGKYMSAGAAQKMRALKEALYIRISEHTCPQCGGSLRAMGCYLKHEKDCKHYHTEEDLLEELDGEFKRKA